MISVPTFCQLMAAADPDRSMSACRAHQLAKDEHQEISSSQSGLPTLAWYLSISGFVPRPGCSFSPYSSSAISSNVFVAIYRGIIHSKTAFVSPAQYSLIKDTA